MISNSKVCTKLFWQHSMYPFIHGRIISCSSLIVLIRSLTITCICDDVISVIQLHRLGDSFSIMSLRIVLNCSISLCCSCTLEMAIINGCILFFSSLSKFAISLLRYFACSIIIILNASFGF